jgi:hypothetical protein
MNLVTERNYQFVKEDQVSNGVPAFKNNTLLTVKEIIMAVTMSADCQNK